MNRHVDAIAGRLSLRPPQRHSLEILDRITEIVPPKKGADIAVALAAIKSEFPTVTDFEREFPSLCFALAGGGKARFIGTFVRASGGCLGGEVVPLSVRFKHTDEPRDFELELGVDGRGVVERVEAAHRFEASGAQPDLRRAQISGGTFEGMCRPFDRG